MSARKAKKIAEKVLEKLAVKYIGLEAVRGFMLKKIEAVTPDDTYKAIKDGTHIWPLTSEKDKRKGKRWAKKFAKYKDELKPENVIKWLSIDRPEIASVIIHMPDKQGIKWLAKETNDFKHNLWPKKQVES